MNAFRDWLNTQLGADGGRAVQMILALLVVVLLLVGLAWIFRRVSGRMHLAGRGQRLSVVDAAPVDGRRRLLLLRRDDVEHLVMVGGPNDLLVESRIVRGAQTVAARPAGPVVTQSPPAPPRQPVEDDKETPRALPGAAALASAVAGAGAFVRSRLARSETPAEPAPRRPAAEDRGFDAPLGQPVVPGARPAERPTPAPAAEPALVAPPTVEPPPARPAPKPAPEKPPVAEKPAAPAAPPAPPAPPAAAEAPKPVVKPPKPEEPAVAPEPAATAPVPPPKPVAPPPAAAKPVAPPPAAKPAEPAKPKPAAPPAAAAPAEPIAPPPPAPAPAPAAAALGAAAFGTAAVEAALAGVFDLEPPPAPPTRPEPKPPVAAPQRSETADIAGEIERALTDLAAAPSAAQPPQAAPEIDLLSELDLVVTSLDRDRAKPEAPFVEPPPPAPAPAPAERLEPHFGEAPAEAAPAAEAPPVAPPPVEAPHPPLDELEEEMARLLAEISGQQRR